MCMRMYACMCVHMYQLLQFSGEHMCTFLAFVLVRLVCIYVHMHTCIYVHIHTQALTGLCVYIMYIQTVFMGVYMYTSTVSSSVPSSRLVCIYLHIYTRMHAFHAYVNTQINWQPLQVQKNQINIHYVHACHTHIHIHKYTYMQKSIAAASAKK
jgi:hypothetical protein